MDLVTCAVRASGGMQKTKAIAGTRAPAMARFSGVESESTFHEILGAADAFGGVSTDLAGLDERLEED